jgi:TonB family protein
LFFQESLKLSSFSKIYPSVRALLTLIFLSTVTVTAVAQSSVFPSETSGPDPTMARIERARALAAAHQLPAAATELEAVRSSVKDTAVRNITTLMLIGVYLEQGNYVRPVALLDESFQARSTQKDDSVRTYFAVAGQAINGVRSKLARYRSFGINVGDPGLPAEALKDIDQIRFVLERLIAQANELTSDNGRAYDAWALKEDVLGIRLSLPRDSEDRDRWQAEYVSAREKLASRQIQIASIGRPPALEAVTAKIPNPFSTSKPTASPETTSPTKRADTPVDSTASTSGSSEAGPPASPQTSTEPRTFSTGSFHGKEKKRVNPVYPELAKKNGVYGTVRVFILVDENGLVTVKRSEGPALLRAPAEEAAKGWVFRQTIVDGQPVRVSAYLDFEFKP